jgi:hypothetical protein
MSTVQLPPADTEPGEHDVRGEAENLPRCTVCSHRLADHDAISLRYCQATQVQALPRNCICRVQ